MYNEILNCINNNSRIICWDNAEGQISHMIKLYLSQNAISNKIIIDMKDNIDFIRSNLIINESVKMVPYQSDTEIAEVLQDVVKKNKDFILIAKPTFNVNKASEVFDISIEINDKEAFVINRLSKETVVII
ncbi:hypothetical protein [Oceanobacillus massiliensis]|uniref:hypothetical protein n=1 Tax=Oceanobacillus massiliensis TaxID=1465765 RepID=UPI003018D9CE